MLLPLLFQTGGREWPPRFWARASSTRRVCTPPRVPRGPRLPSTSLFYLPYHTPFLQAQSQGSRGRSRGTWEPIFASDSHILSTQAWLRAAFSLPAGRFSVLGKWPGPTRAGPLALHAFSPRLPLAAPAKGRSPLPSFQTTLPAATGPPACRYLGVESARGI